MSGVEVLERLGWVVIHASWIGALGAAVLHVALMVLGRASANVRHGVACAALGAVVLAVVVVGFAAFMPSVGAGEAGDQPGSASSMVTPFFSPSAGAAIESGDVAGAGRTGVFAGVLVVVGWALGVAAPWLAVVSLVVTGFALARLGVALVRVSRLSATLRALPDLAARSGVWAERVGRLRGVRVVESTVVAVPMVLSLVRPIVVVPTGLRGSMPSEQLDLIVLHELEHVRRGDPWIALVQVVVEALFAVHPGVRWISHQVRIEREVRCDAGVVRVTGDHRAYGRALLHLADFASSVRPTVLLAATGGDLVIRIRRLSGRRAAIMPHRFALSLAGLVAACGVGVAFAQMLPAVPGERIEIHPYHVTPMERRGFLSDEHGQYRVVSMNGLRSQFADGYEVSLEARYYLETRKARFVLAHSNLEQWLSTHGVIDARLTVLLGESVISVTDLTDILGSSVIPSTIVETPLRDSRFAEDLSDDRGRTTRVCARFELTYEAEGYLDKVLQACDQPLIVRGADALPLPRSDLTTERDASFMQFLVVHDQDFSARTIESPRSGVIQLFEVHGRTTLADATAR